MKKILLVCAVLLASSARSFAQCTITGSTATGSNGKGATCVCSGGGLNCDLLPDISIARLPLTQSSNYTEYPQVCNPSCSGNDGRLRLGVSTPIIGYGPLETRGTTWYVCGTDTINAGSLSNIPATCPGSGLPPKQLINQRIYQKNGSDLNYWERPAGSMTYHPSHGHQHVDNWGIYTLRTNNGDPNPVNWPIIGTGTKLGFCLIDLGNCTSSNGYCTDPSGNILNNTNIPNYGLGGGNYGCSQTVQGITNGYMDTYSQSLDGMWINIPPGICNGTYYVVVEIDPLNYFLETNETNNVVAVPITLTQQAGGPVTITPNGPTSFCQGGSVTLTATSGALNYLWSNGATTQSIVVNSSGTFTVSINTTTSCPTTSSPVTVTVAPLTVNAQATPASICPGQTVQLSSSSSASATANTVVAFSNNTPVFIPDYNSAGVTSPIVVSGLNPSLLGANTIVSVTLNLTHTYDGDLIISLISPSGNQINLSNRRGGGGDNFINTVFSMSAITPIASGTAPFTGSYIPDGAFSTLTGNLNGSWQLKVADVAAVDTGRIQNWTLRLYNQIPNVVSYSWSSIPAGFNSVQQNPSAGPAVSTTYTVSISDLNGCTGTAATQVTVNSNPTVSIANTGTTICLNQSTTLTASGAQTYSWSPATGLNTTQGPVVIASPSVTTTYTVTGTSTAGCTGTSTVTIINSGGTVPSTPGSMSGPAKVCPGATGIAYSINTVSGATGYTWTLPQGATLASGAGSKNITVNFSSGFTGGALCVTADNSCGSSPQKCKTLSPDIPARPGTLAGPANGVCNSSQQYSFAPVTGATSYTWTVPANTSIQTGQGTNTLQLLFQQSFVTGSVCVVSNNSCGSSQSRCLTVKASPLKPVSISGPQVVCPNQTETYYSVSPVFGASSYSWTAPSGSAIVGQGNPLVSVNFGSASGNISCKAVNACGSSSKLLYPITVACRTGFENSETIWDLYPNPASESVRIQFRSNISAEGTIQIKDVTGRSVYSMPIQVFEGDNRFEADTRSFAKGVYMVVININEQVNTGKLIIE